MVLTRKNTHQHFEKGRIKQATRQMAVGRMTGKGKEVQIGSFREGNSSLGNIVNNIVMSMYGPAGSWKYWGTIL